MLVFTADLHLSPIIWNDLPAVQGDAYYALKQITDYCVAKPAEALILGGDIFNRNTPDSSSVHVFCDCMNLLNKHNIPVFAIQGQHDRSYPPWFELALNVNWLQPQIEHKLKIDGDQFVLRGFDNMDIERVKSCLDALPECDILVMHQALKSVLSFENAWNLDDTWIPEFVKLVLLGDVHVEAVTGKCYYSGSTHLRAANENPQKSFINIRNQDGKLSVGRVMLDSRKILSVSISNDQELASALVQIAQLQGEYKLGPLVLAKVAADVKDAYGQLIRACKDKQAYLRVRDLAAPVEKNAVPATTATAVTLEECLSRVVDREKQKELYTMLQRILTTPAVEDELAAIKTELGIVS